MAMTCVPCQALAAVEEEPIEFENPSAGNNQLLANGVVAEDNQNAPAANSKLNVDAHLDLSPNNYGNWIATENNDGTLTVVGCRALSEYIDSPLTIPDTIEGMTVTGIAGYPSEIYSDGYFNVFSPELVTEIIFPDTVTHMDGYKIFRDFKNLKAITFPNNPDFRGGEDCFAECEMLETVTARRNPGFSYGFKKVKTFNVHEGADEILGDGGENIRVINLPSTIKQFGWNNAPNLRELNCPKDLKDISIITLSGCKSLHIAVHVFPTEYTEDFRGSFDNSGITELNIDGAYLPNGFIRLQDAISDCPYLTAINVGEGAQYFYSEDGILYWQYPGQDPDLFAYPAGKSTQSNYTVPSYIFSIYPWAFDGCKFTSITIPEDINPHFRWDIRPEGWDPEGQTWTYISALSEINAKLRVIKGSPAFWSYYSKTDMADFLKMDENRIELYKGNRYSISYELNGGINAPSNPTSYQAGDDKVILGIPTKKGYKFLGWKRDDVSSDYMDTTERQDYFRDYIFTAEWEKIVLTIPKGIKEENLNNGIRVSWNSVPDAEGYYIYRKTGNGSWTKISSVSGDKTTYTDKTVKGKNAKSFIYAVEAYGSGMVSGFNQNGKTIVRLTSPNLSKLINKPSKKMKIMWKKNSKAQGYQIQYSTDSKFKKVKMTRVSSKNAKSRIIKNLKKKKTYYVRMRCYKKIKGTTYYSAWSNAKKIKIKK